jgi:hypothetical protein
MDAAAIAARCLPRHVHLLSRAYEGCALLNSSRFLLQVRRGGFWQRCVMFCVIAVVVNGNFCFGLHSHTHT